MTAAPSFVDLAAVAEILSELGDEIEQMGVELCLDPAVSLNHMTILQNIDLIAQRQRGLALVLQTDCPLTARAAIGLEELKVRLGLT